MPNLNAIIEQHKELGRRARRLKALQKKQAAIARAHAKVTALIAHAEAGTEPTKAARKAHKK